MRYRFAILLALLLVRLTADPDLIFTALYNYDTMRGTPEVERAMLDAMKSAGN